MTTLYSIPATSYFCNQKGAGDSYTFANLRAGVGNVNSNILHLSSFQAGGGANTLTRGVWNFDTSVIPVSENIAYATLNFRYKNWSLEGAGFAYPQSLYFLPYRYDRVGSVVGDFNGSYYNFGGASGQDFSDAVVMATFVATDGVESNVSLVLSAAGLSRIYQLGFNSGIWAGAASSNSLAIGTGSKTLTVGTGLGFIAGNPIIVTHNALNYMRGTVTSLVGTTLIVNITSVVGSGTYNSWNSRIPYTSIGLLNQYDYTFTEPVGYGSGILNASILFDSAVIPTLDVTTGTPDAPTLVSTTGGNKQNVLTWQ